MINKNKDEILNKINKMNHMLKIDYKYARQLEIQIEATIKTSILWCEEEINFLKDSDFLSSDDHHCDECDYNCHRINKKITQLQTHLKWLKEQEQIE